MALKLYANGSLKITGTDAFTLDNLENCNFNPNATVTSMGSAGNSRPSFVYTADSSPTFTATVRDLGTLLGKVDINGGLAIGTTAHATIEMYWTKKALVGETSAGSTHFKTVAAKALLVVRNVKVQQGGVASADIEVITYSSDGVTDPVTQTDSVAVTCAAADEIYTLGPVLIPSAHESATGFTINTNIEIDSVISGGAVYPVWVGIKQVKPTISVTTSDVTLLNAYGSDGAAIGADWVLYARKCENTGTRIADATEEHIAFLVNEDLGMVHAQQFSAAGDRANAEGTILITPITDCTTTNLIAVDTTAAIS